MDSFKNLFTGLMRDFFASLVASLLMVPALIIAVFFFTLAIKLFWIVIQFAWNL